MSRLYLDGGIRGLIWMHRQDLYKRGGLMSVTSRILVVDMLQSDIPIDLITGILVLHAEKCVHFRPAILMLA